MLFPWGRWGGGGGGGGGGGIDVPENSEGTNYRHPWRIKGDQYLVQHLDWIRTSSYCINIISIHQQNKFKRLA